MLDDLARSPHFRSLPKDLLAKVAALARVVRYRAGETIFSQGEPCRAFFLIRSGAVRVYRLSADGREQTLHHLRAGHSFAEAALLSIGSFPAHAVALEKDTELIEIEGRGFLALFHSEPRLASSMVGSLSMWLLSLVERVEELSVASAGARLARYLLKLPARGGAGLLSIELPMAKKELAAHLAIAPETLSRLLRRWQDRGIVAVQGGSIEVRDARVLEALADREDDG